MINIQNMTVLRRKRTIIDQLDLTVAQGEVLALIAPNGTGKTTLLRAVTQLLPARYDQLEINAVPAKDYQAFRKAFFFLENPGAMWEHLSIREHLLFLKKMWQSPQSVEEVIATLSIDSYANEPIAKMSLGMKQHALLAAYLMADTKVQLFDEPLNGLDPGSIEKTNHIIRDEAAGGKTIVMSSHDINNIQEVCTRAVFLKAGKIAEDTTDMSELKNLYRELY